MQITIAFTFATLLSTTLNVLITLTLIVTMIRHLRHERDVSLLLILNTYITVFAYSAVLLSTTINVLRADLYGVAVLDHLNLAGCQFQGFLHFALTGCCYMSFVLQALYRLARVVYAKHKFLQVRPPTLHFADHLTLLF